MSNENRTALEASIRKWAGVGDNNGCGGRGEERKLEVSLSATQLKLLKERMGSDSQKDVLQRMLHDQTGEGGGRSLTSNIQLACGGGGGGFCNNSTSENNNSSMASENAQQ